MDKYFDTQTRISFGSPCRAGHHSQKHPETQCQSFLDRLKKRAELERKLSATQEGGEDLQKKKEELNQRLKNLVQEKTKWVQYLAQMPFPARFNYNNTSPISLFPTWFIDVIVWMSVKIQGLA